MDFKEKHTLFFDRLSSVTRTAEREPIINLGGPADGIKIRIKNNFAHRCDTPELDYAWGATCGVYLTLQSRTILCARIDHNILKVSADGKCVQIPFCDDHLRENCRCYNLTFFDDNAACLFCWNYQRLLPRKVERRLEPLRFTYHEMMEMLKMKKDFDFEARNKALQLKAEREEEKLLFGSSDEELSESDYNNDTTDERSRDTEEQDSSTDDNEFNALFLEEQFGHSQAF